MIKIRHGWGVNRVGTDSTNDGACNAATPFASIVESAIATSLTRP